VIGQVATWFDLAAQQPMIWKMQAKPLRGRFASLDSSAAAKGRHYGEPTRSGKPAASRNSVPVGGALRRA
jgi:hypothetical protein